ncbi:RNA-binding protein [uncultured Desulfuromusa sp.]|uniref:RNA recognition motif domain-containing protein n=1 Tax=uncultured Desulfuromusa sp. TaxID=219183 RepID=UPI002AA8D568|nr:RNA-binding protein [uncultured Desulfuromusa sp.]
MKKAKSPIKDIFVADISFEATEEDLHKLFSVCGTVRSIHMLTDPKNGNFKGVAFIRMATDAENREAINMLDGTRLIDRCINVSAAKSKEEMAVVDEVVELPEKRTRRRRVPKGRKKVR